MSFRFNWNSCNDESFYSRAKTLLTDALNKSNKPAIIVDRIVVEDLSLGNDAPEFEILEIGDLAEDRFRGIFKLTYAGDASITLATKVQANPLAVYAQNCPKFAMPNFVGASSSLALPLNLTLSEIKLSGIIILVFSKAKGLTLVFRNDPLESIKVSSTFDALPGIARFLQVQIENQIRVLFREELPTILHRLSHRWTGSASAEQGESTTPAVSKVKPVALMEINPDVPEFSPSNMLKLEALCATHKTLNPFTPAVPEAVYRSSLESFEVRKRDESKHDVQSIAGGDDLYDIMRAQTKSVRSTNSPRRRVVKIKRPGKAAAPQQSADGVAVPATSTSSAVPVKADDSVSVRVDSVPQKSEPVTAEARAPTKTEGHSVPGKSVLTLETIPEHPQVLSTSEPFEVDTVDSSLPGSPHIVFEKVPLHEIQWGRDQAFAMSKQAMFKDFFSRNSLVRPEELCPPPAYDA